MPDYGRDPVAFARDLLGLTLQPHQVEALRAEAGVKTILKGRQAGGSLTIRVKVLWDCYRFPGHLALVSSASNRQATELGEGTMAITESSPIARSLTRRTTERMTFSNQSEAYFLPNNPRTIRGFSVRGLGRKSVRPGVTGIQDEACHAENGDATRKAIEYALATAPPDRREYWIVSTPTTSDAWPMKYFALGQQREPGFWSARWPSDLNRYVDTDWLARMRATKLPAEVATEIDGVPADDVQALFAPLLPQIVDPALPWPVPTQPGDMVGVGADLALPYSRGADYSVVLPVGRHWDGAAETWTVLDLWRERMYRETDLLATLLRWHERYTVARIVVEQYGSTGVVEGALQARLPVETVAPTPANQAEAFGRLFTLAKEGRLRIPAGATALLDELRIIRHTIGETGTPRFSAPGGRHDDTVFALAWAARAVASLVTPGRWAAGLPVLAGGERATAIEAYLRSGRGPVIESWDEKSIRIHEQRTRSGRPGLIL